MDIYHGPWNPNKQPGESDISIYLYQPWLGGAVAGIAAFGCTLLIQLFFLSRSKSRGTRWFHGCLAFGSLMEVGGYAARVKGHLNMYLVSIFVAQYFLIVVAPIPVAASIYLVLTYAAKRFPGGDRLLLISPKRLVQIFVLVDVVTVIVQVCGAALIGVVQVKISRDEEPPISSKAAADILLGGLAVQCASFLTFITLLFVAIKRTRSIGLGHPVLRNLRILLGLNLAAAMFILLRTVYRLAAECQGYFGTANSSQTLFTCLEFLPVILAIAVFSVVPISKFFPSEEDLATGQFVMKESSNASSNPYGAYPYSNQS